MFLDPGIFALTIAFMFLLVLLLIGAIYSKVHWLLKSVLIVASLAISVTFYVGFRDSLGWPVSDKPSKQFQFLWAVVDEPLPAQNKEGAIFLWYLDLTPGARKEPRSVKLPYNRETHKKVEQGKQGVKEGKTVIMGEKGEEGEGADAEAQKGQKKAKGGPQGHADAESDAPMFDFIAPPSTLPPKNGS